MSQLLFKEPRMGNIKFKLGGYCQSTNTPVLRIAGLTLCFRLISRGKNEKTPIPNFQAGIYKLLQIFSLTMKHIILAKSRLPNIGMIVASGQKKTI
jgi:hypothetical protein